MIAAILIKLRKKMPPGALFVTYLALFGILRFFLFFVRGDVPVRRVKKRGLMEAIELSNTRSTLRVSVCPWLLWLRSLFLEVHGNNSKSNHRRHAAAPKGHSSVVDSKAQRDRRTKLPFHLTWECLSQVTFDPRLLASLPYKDRARQYLLPYKLETATRYRG